MPTTTLNQQPDRKRLNTLVGVACAAALLNCVPKFEGRVLRAYKDPIGIVTVCTGHTKTVALGRPYTPAECDELLVQDLIAHAEGVNRCIKYPMTTYQRAAAVSFAFNIGVSAFCQSTMAKKFNAGDVAGACAELSKWTHAGGRELPGLVERRKIERSMCEGKLQ